jgi:hypothetical protein
MPIISKIKKCPFSDFANKHFTIVNVDNDRQEVKLFPYLGNELEVQEADTVETCRHCNRKIIVRRID